MSQEANPGQILREHLFEGELLQLPAPEEGAPGFMPEWFDGPLPVLVYPPFRERQLEEGQEVNLEVTPYHIYYGTLRELAEAAGGTERSDALRRLALEWNPSAALEVCELARKQVERALLHYELAQELDGSIEGIDETVEHCEAALEVAPAGAAPANGQEGQPTPEQAAFAEAQVALAENPARSIELLKPLAEAYPDAGEVWFILGSAYRRLGETEEAERCLRRAGRLAPAEPFVWWELTQACMDASHWRPAEEAIRKAIEIDPENAIFLCDLGRILLALGDREGAEDAIFKARDLVPDDPTVQEALGLLEG